MNFIPTPLIIKRHISSPLLEVTQKNIICIYWEKVHLKLLTKKFQSLQIKLSSFEVNSKVRTIVHSKLSAPLTRMVQNYKGFMVEEWVNNKGSISPMFYKQLLHEPIPKAQKDSQVIIVFWHFGDLHIQKLLIKCWWNRPKALLQIHPWRIFFVSIDHVYP